MPLYITLVHVPAPCASLIDIRQYQVRAAN
jgi:hypothetical protein